MIKIITKSLTLVTRNTQSYGELKYTQQLEVQSSFPHVNTYRAIDLDGKLLDTTVKYDPNYLTKILDTMIRVDEMDQILLKVKAQGRISFYMSSFGEHACIVGSAAALDSQDLVYTQYREQGAHIWRGYTLENIINQCIGNCGDAAKGRQMPVHYGSKALNNVTVSSPLTTQVPQAAGSGYSFRTANKSQIAACYLGEGAASEGDFPTALNFAATLRSQTLFLCRNNKYAISTGTEDQYVSDGIIPRAIAFNIASTRVDGNDAIACLQVTRRAREYILTHKKPYFIEFMTYRIGDHSTSDNSKLYRSEGELKEWKQKNNPILRLTKFLKSINHQTSNESQLRQQVSKEVIDTLNKCQKLKYPSLDSLFDDVYDTLPPHLIEQRQQLRDHLKQYGDKYEFLGKYKSE